MNTLRISPGLELNKRINAEDRVPHDSIGAIITKPNKDGEMLYLTLDHVKWNMLTPPVGKVKPDQSIVEGLLVEIKEELGISVESYLEICQYSKEYDMNGKKVAVNMHIFKIIRFKGTISNKEPSKHRSIKWLTRDELEKSNRKLGDAFIRYFTWLDDINTPSLIKPNVTVGRGS